MPNGISENIYSGGAVRFDPSRSTGLYINLMQKKLAREEALDEYERDRINRINDAGVRNVDREGLDKRILDLKSYFNTNKDLIRRGNNAAAFEYEKKFRDVITGINKSKDATARAETFNKLRQERLKYGRNTPDDWFKDYAKHEQTSVWDEKFEPMDLTKFMSQQAPKYDQAKTMKLFSDIKRTPGQAKYVPVPGQPFKQQEIIEERYDDKAKETIAARAKELYDSDDGFAYEVLQDFNNPVKKVNLEKVFIEEFKTQPQDFSDYAVAKKMMELQPVITKTKMVDDWKSKTDYQDALIRGRIRLSHSLGGFNISKAGGKLDLTSYKTAPEGSKFIPELLSGYVLSNEPISQDASAQFGSDNVYYNPETGKFIYYDAIKKRSVPKDYKTFIQDIYSLNPQKDITHLLRLPLGNSTIGEKMKEGADVPKPKPKDKPKDKKLPLD